MDAELNLTESDILTLLEQAKTNPIANDDPIGARTIEDLAKEMKVCQKTARKRLKRAQERGAIFEKVIVTRYNIWGEPYLVKAIRLPDE